MSKHPYGGARYYGVRIVRAKKNRTVNFYADEIRVENGDLLLIALDEKHDGKEVVYRAFARGTWQDVYSANCMDGSEVGEEHDIDVATGEDARQAGRYSETIERSRQNPS